MPAVMSNGDLTRKQLTYVRSIDDAGSTGAFNLPTDAEQSKQIGFPAKSLALREKLRKLVDDNKSYVETINKWQAKRTISQWRVEYFCEQLKLCTGDVLKIDGFEGSQNMTEKQLTYGDITWVMVDHCPDAQLTRCQGMAFLRTRVNPTSIKQAGRWDHVTNLMPELGPRPPRVPKLRGNLGSLRTAILIYI